MKKLIFILAILLSCALTAIQGQDKVTVWGYATSTTPLGRTIQSGDVVLVNSTGLMIRLTATFGATATPASIVTDGHYKAFPQTGTGIISLTPATNGGGTVGTSSLKFGTGYINAIINKDSIEPLTTGGGMAGTSTHHFGTGYINTLANTYLNGIYGVFTHTQITADSCTTGYASTRFSSPSIFCTGSSGAIFTSTNGTYWKLQLNSSGTATYVSVTP